MTDPNRLSVCGLILDVASQEVFVNGIAQRLTPMQCRLLATFMRHPG